MKLYKQVHKGTLGNVIGYRRERLVSGDRLPVGERYSSNINVHINNRAGIYQDETITDGPGIVKGTNKNTGKSFYWQASASQN